MGVFRAEPDLTWVLLGPSSGTVYSSATAVPLSTGIVTFFPGLLFSQRETGALSEVAERAEYLLLRDSEYKFHAPAWR